MSITEHAPLPQSQIDHYDDMRASSDAELIRQGGEHINGVLYANPQQLELLEQQDPSNNLGKLVLHSIESETISGQLEGIVRATENFSGVYEGLQDAAMPYTTLFQEHVPEPGKYDYTWRGKLKDESSIEPWSTDRRLDLFRPHYVFSGSYAPGEKANLLKHVQTDISNIGETDTDRPAISIGLDYNQYMLRQITVASQPFSDKLAYRDLRCGPSAVKDSMKGLCKGQNLNITFDNNTITMVKQTAGDYRPTTFTYHADQDTLQMDSKTGGMDGQTFLKVVHDYLRLIPTMRETY